MVNWNLEDIYPESEKENLMNLLSNKVNEFISKKEVLNENLTATDLIYLFVLKDEILSISSSLQIKLYLKFCEDVTNQNTLKEMQKLEMYLADLENKLLFFQDFLKNMAEIKSKSLENNLGKYNYLFKSIRKNIPFMKSMEEEKIMNLKDISGHSILLNLRNLITGKFEFDFNGEKINEAKLISYTMSEKEEERKLAYELLLSKYIENQDELGEIYKGISLDWLYETTKIRNYSSPLSARNFSNTINDDVIDLILNITQNKCNLFQKYFKLKSNYFKIKNSRYNIYAPFILKQKKDYSFEYSKELVLEVYKNFSDNFFNLANNIFEHQHVHSDSLKNKKSGAFCYSYDKDKIPFILLNHNNDLNSLFTMAHELGHGIHSSLSKNKTQSTFHPSIVIAETASIFGEMLLMDHLKNKASKEEKLYILFHHLDSLFSTILRQIYFTLFEIKAYDKILQGASIAELSEIYNTILTQQFNDMEISEQFNFEWLRIPHIFESPFYCYSYAFGNLLVLALFKLYEKDKESFVTKYTNILSQGGDEDVSEILIKSGIDISNQEFWESAFNKIEDYLTELETLVNN